MAENSKTLRRRIRSVTSTKQVTRAMEMVSAAKLRRAQAALMAARPYVSQLEMLMGRLAPLAEVTGHPLFEARRVRKSTLVVYSADRGLCGSYNATMIRMAERYMKEQGRGRTELVLIGRRAAEYFGRRSWPIAEKYTGMGGVLDRDQSNGIANFLRDRYLEGKTDEINLLYTSFVSTSVNRPVFEKFLDLDQSTLMRKSSSQDRSQGADYIFEPSQEFVFDQLVPAFLLSKIYITLAEAFTSEHSSRMLAMNGASKSCDEMQEMLTLRMNKARQFAITADLLDIVGGAEALQQG